MSEVVFSIKSNAKTPEEVLEAIESQTDWFYSRDEDLTHAEKLGEVEESMGFGFITADGENVTMWMC